MQAKLLRGNRPMLHSIYVIHSAVPLMIERDWNNAIILATLWSPTAVFANMEHTIDLNARGSWLILKLFLQ
jgi:hypothetical protein